MKLLSVVAVLAAGLFLIGCATHTNLTPLGGGKWAPYVGVGGPIVEAFDTHLPVPYLLAGADFGIGGDANLSGALHLLPLAYGIVGVDFGGSWFPFMNEGVRPTLGLGPRFFLFASTKSDVDDRLLAYPAASLSAAWGLGRGLLYIGADAAVPLERSDYDEEAHPVIVSPFVGYRWHLGRRYALLTEVKWHGANIVSREMTTGYTGIGPLGAVTPLISVQRRF